MECILNPSEQADYGKSLRFFQRMGWKLRDAKYIYLIQSEEDGSFVYTRLKYHFRQMYPDVQFMRYQMYYLALVHDSQDILERIRHVLEELGRWISFTAGVSFPFYDLLEAPAALSIHINTLKYRLKQIQEQFAADLRDDGERMHLLFSFLLLSAEGKMPVWTDYGENRR